MASTTAGKKKYGLPVKVAVVLLIFVQMTQAFCNPSLAGIMADFPEAPVTTVQTIINIATLVMIPAALVTGPIVNKIGYKTTGIIAMVIALVGGVAPAFVHPSVEFMIFERGVFGIGYGMVLRAGANSAAPIQSPEQARNALRAVTKDEVRDILRRLTLSVSYLLTKEDTAHAAE